MKQYCLPNIVHGQNDPNCLNPTTFLKLSYNLCDLSSFNNPFYQPILSDVECCLTNDDAQSNYQINMHSDKGA